MPVKGNEESGVLSGQTNNCYAGIPIKKRRFPVIPPPSPPREETPTDSLPEKNHVINKEEYSSGKELSLNANLPIDSPDKYDVSKNLLKEVKIEVPVAVNVNQFNMADLSGSGSRETRPSFCPGSVNVIIDRKVNASLVEKPASSLIAPGSKKQIITQRAEGYFEHELSAGSRNVELSLRLKEQFLSASGHKQSEGSSWMPDKIDPSLLTLSLSGENPNTESNTMYSGLPTTTTTARAHIGANRSNWDLNTTMDAWESSVKGTVDIDGLNKTSSYSVKPSSSVVGVAIVKGKQVVDPSEKISNSCNSSMLSGQQYKSEESLHLSLGTFFPESDFSREYSTSSPKVGSSRITSDSNLQKLTTKITSGCRIMKTEPVDENLRRNPLPFYGNPMGSLEPILVKREIAGRHNMEASKMSSSNPQKLVESGSVKSEMGQESNKDTCGDTTNVIIHQSVEKVVQRQESSSSSSTIISMPLTPQQPGSSLVPNCLKLPAIGSLRDLSEHSLPTHDVCNSEGTMDHPAADMISKLENHIAREPIVSDCKANSGQAEDLNVEDSEISRLERTEEIGSTAEGPVCDEEKINISANTVEEDAYGSEYESDGDHSLGGQVDMEDEQCGKEENEYEDGEVREPPIRSSVEDPTFEVMETPNVKHAEDDTEMAHPIYPCDCSAERYHINGKQSELEIIDETNSDHTRVSIGLTTNVNSDQLIEDEFSMPKSLSKKATALRADERRPESAPLHQSGEKDVAEANRKDLSADEATTMNCGTVSPVDEVTGEIVQGTNAIGYAESSLTKAESSLDGHDAAKESVTGGNRSRIIHLPRASNFTSPSRMRSIPGRSLSSRGGRERCCDLERDNLHVRGNRDDMYADIPNKFSRDRKQNQSYRNSRDFTRGRGRVSGRVDTFQGEWDPPEHDFASRTFDGPVGYRFARHKRDGGHECNDFVAAPDETALGASRGLRKPLTEELYSFRHSSSRRISPGARNVPVTRNNQMLHRLQRNTGEAGSDLAGLRHEKKFMRSLPDDMTDSVYTRPQAGYEELDAQFVRGNRKFSTAQRRGFPCVRSKSPINNRSRSPRPWISPRRRLTDGFNNNLADQSQHRSPAMYRMRSPGRVSYIEEMGSRRHVSPNYVARPSNEMNSARGRGHIRSINSGGRSPSDRVFPRSNRRVDVVDTRKCSRGDDYFDGGPIHAGRFHEFRCDGSSDERKSFGERRSPVPSFRPTTYIGNNSDGYCLNSDDGSRPRRFFPDQDTEIFERGGDIRERDFDGLIKNRPSRRIRNIEEQEVKYRQTGQIWHDDAFGDESRLKRRRF